MLVSLYVGGSKIHFQQDVGIVNLKEKKKASIAKHKELLDITSILLSVLIEFVRQ